AVTLARAGDAREDFSNQQPRGSVDGRPAGAVPAVAAGLVRRRVAEITKDGGAQAAGGFGVGDHAPQFLALDVLPARNLRRIDGDVRAARSVIARPIDEELARFDVGVVPQQRRYRGPSIAAGAAHLLVVGFE